MTRSGICNLPIAHTHHLAAASANELTFVGSAGDFYAAGRIRNPDGLNKQIEDGMAIVAEAFAIESCSLNDVVRLKAPAISTGPESLQPFSGRIIQFQAIAQRSWRKHSDVRVAWRPVPPEKQDLLGGRSSLRRCEPASSSRRPTAQRKSSSTWYAIATTVCPKATLSGGTRPYIPREDHWLCGTGRSLCLTVSDAIRSQQTGRGLEMTGPLNGNTSHAWVRQVLDCGAGMELDRIDARLLDLVQRNNRLSSEELGAKVGLSASGVQRRLKRLRAEGVIESDVSIISPRAVGRNVTALILIFFERDRADIVDRFKRSICKMPEVMSGFYVTGQADFLLLVTANDMEDYEYFTRRLVHESSDIKRFETMVILHRAKVGFTVPLDSIACW